MEKLILLLLAIMLTACSLSARSEYDQNRSKWESANIPHYRYALFMGCFCPFMNDMPLEIEVNNGEVVSMTRADGTIVSPADPLYETASPYSTIDRLFASLKADLGGSADEVTVSYDPTYGYPTNISIDVIKQAVDEELSLQISDFEVLK